MSDDQFKSPSLLNRLLQNPVTLRRKARLMAVVIAAIAGVAGSGWLDSGPLAGALTGLVWLCVPFVAIGIGIGDAFFLRHGIGERRVALSGLLGLIVAVTGCVVLAVVNSGDDDGSALLAGALYFLLVVGVVAVLATGISIAVGKGSGYLSRRIQDVDDSGW